MAAESSIVFSVNGERKEISSRCLDPRKTLAEYLRQDLRLTGTKISCGEGGCGACTVTVEHSDGTVRSVNSCLFPVANLDGLAVTTVEGLGGKHGKNLHPIQERIAKFNGLQCGYCTPGMVNNTYSFLKEHGNKLDEKTVERLYDGNLCRCTGYRPLLDASKSLCADIEDIGGCRPHNPAKDDPQFPDFLKDYQAASSSLNAVSKDGATQWVRPITLEGALQALADAKAPIARPVVANTGAAIYKDTLSRHQVSNGSVREVFVSLSGVSSLNQVETTADGIRIGGAVTIRSFDAALREADAKSHGVFSRMSQHLNRIGNRHVRAAGSVAGNISLCKKHGFWSDAAVVLTAANAAIHLVSNGLNRTTQTMEEFLSSPNYASPDQIIEHIFVPFPPEGSVWRSFKLSLRPQNAHALANAAFLVQAKGQDITNARLVFGCISSDPKDTNHVVLAPKTAAAMSGKPADSATLQAALATLAEEVQPRGEELNEYRRDLYAGFLFKLFRALGGDKAAVEEDEAFGHFKQNATKSSQQYKVAEKDQPVHQPIPKITGPNLASGDGRFGDDFLPPNGCLFGAYVHSTEARAALKSVNADDALKLPGVVRLVTAKDVKGKNNCSGLGQEHPVFAEDRVLYHGQPIALILATSTRLARDAARLVVVEYDTEGKKPVLSIEDALAQNMVTPVVAAVKNKEGPDVDAQLKESKHVAEGTIHLGSQLHFYMETHNVQVTPDEDESYVIQSPCQWPAAYVGGLCTTLGLPQNRVRLIHRRSGGGFGGRLTHTLQFAAAAAVASHATGRPVRLVMDRDSDTPMCGGREETLCKYTVGYDDDGKIQALKVVSHLGAGFNVDLSWFSNMVVPNSLGGCYNIPSFDLSSTVVITDKGTRTAVRGPGEIAASYTMETVLERIAHELGKDITHIRHFNLFPAEGEHKVPNGNPLLCYTVPEMWKKMEEKSNYAARRAAVDEFNKSHRWVKRGLSFTSMRYEVGVWPKSALVNIMVDGSIIISHGCSDIGQGCNVKIAQVASSVLGKLAPVPLESIRFSDMDSWVVVNQTFTGGSTGTEGAAAAVLQACESLAEKMRPTLEGLQAKKDEEAKGEKVSWGELCGAAGNGFPAQPYALSAVGQWTNAGDDALIYQNYGVGVSEVELDVLTGQVRPTYASIIYDCGESLNPAIDIGQAEGAFVMGLGAYLREGCHYDPENGKMLTPSTWDYKPSFAGDLPENFEVEFLHNPAFSKGVLSSKASGEPPLVLADAVVLAVRDAVRSARTDAGKGNEWFEMEVPATSDVIRRCCAVGPESFKL
eukprot:CAMPEP_0201488286 /NCGR_PEP_ID=MMETSP0151_2-20130828/17867_1 /ASSEMBLY_ACC=CAM_ASM_000257 /TAXON_ID=200890 /ORGANISM="Paramoeba atlantica, Strain 621/1 / CCAP 1560/9" /LENGTH=1295 /DNA_ID=CAMNT_0047873545 /DNA_START=72 /DNA_END=3959 /DNA_ORIENTATION=+